MVKSYLDNHEELVVCLNDLVQLTDVLMVQLLHGGDFSPDTGKVLLDHSRQHIMTILNSECPLFIMPQYT